MLMTTTTANLPSTSSSPSSPSAVAATVVGSCPSCGAIGASFSKRQKKKPAAKRKCVLCVERMMTPERGGGRNGPPSDEMEEGAAKQQEELAKKGDGDITTLAVTAENFEETTEEEKAKKGDGDITTKPQEGGKAKGRREELEATRGGGEKEALTAEKFEENTERARKFHGDANNDETKTDGACTAGNVAETTEKTKTVDGDRTAEQQEDGTATAEEPSPDGEAKKRGDSAANKSDSVWEGGWEDWSDEVGNGGEGNDNVLPADLPERDRPRTDYAAPDFSAEEGEEQYCSDADVQASDESEIDEEASTVKTLLREESDGSKGDRVDMEEDECAGNWSPEAELSEDEKDDRSLRDSPPSGNRRSIKRPSKNNIRDRMKKARDQALGREKRRSGTAGPVSNEGFSDDDGSDSRQSCDGDEEHDDHGVSLEDLKHKVLGRSVSSMYDIDKSAEAALSSSNGQTKLIMDASKAFADGSTVANHLKHDLTCPICHDRLYNPVSLLCGHSFCQSCLNWWLDQQRQRKRVVNVDVDSGEEGGGGGDTCPSCRERIPALDEDGKLNIRVNVTLKAVLDTLYGPEMNQRRLAEECNERKSRAGEAGGSHGRGYEEIVPLPQERDELEFLRDLKAGGSRRNAREEEGWMPLYSSGNRPSWRRGGSKYGGGGARIHIRRNVVLDDSDQRYQLSLGLTKCTYAANDAGGVLDVELCLLTMEEDEVDDSGFPTFVNEGDDDEALICTGSDRVHTRIESGARVVPTRALDKKREPEVFGRRGRGADASHVREVPLSRGMIGQDGSVRFRVDAGKVLERARDSEGGGDEADGFRIVKLTWRHLDTGAMLELRLPARCETNEMDGCGGEGEIEFGAVKPAADTGAARYLMDDREEEEGVVNEYEEDDFLVNGPQDSEEEFDGLDDSDDENDLCQICNKGGDLIVCDGGDHDGGCGHAYHIHCIGRSVVPPGDWICEACARDVGITVGIEGHEWKADSEEGRGEGGGDSDRPIVIDDSDDDDIAPIQSKKRVKRKVMHDPESDDDSESDDEGTRKRIKGDD